MPGISLETIHANHGFAGSDFVQSKAMPFNEAAVYFSTLPSWLNYTGLKVDAFSNPNNVGASWQKPERLYCHLDGVRISTAFDFSANESIAPRSVLIQENPAFFVDDVGDATAEDIHSRFVAPLSRLMAFASENTAKLDRYRLFAKADEDGNTARFDWLYSPSTKTKAKSVDPLFTLGDVPGGFEPFLKSWFTFTKDHPDFCSVFFSYGYEKHGFVETRFLFQMLAAECLVREETTDNKLMRPFEKLRAAFLKESPLSNTPHAAFTLPSAVQLAMPTLFAQFIKDRWGLVKDIVGTTEERFIEALFTTMEYVNQRGDQRTSVVRGSNLLWLTERLAAVLKISVLKRLDFTDKKINALVTSSAEMNHLTTIKAPWGTDGDD